MRYSFLSLSMSWRERESIFFREGSVFCVLFLRFYESDSRYAHFRMGSIRKCGRGREERVEAFEDV